MIRLINGNRHIFDIEFNLDGTLLRGPVPMRVLYTKYTHEHTLQKKF